MKFKILLFLCLCIKLAIAQTKPTFEEEKKAIAYSLLTEAIAKNDSVKMADGYYEMGKYEAGIGNLISGITWFKKAMPLYKKQKRYFEYGRIYQRIAECQMAKKDFRQAKLYSDSAMIVFKTHDLPKGIISNYLFMCGISFDHLKKSPTEILSKFDEMLLFAKNNDLEIEFIFLYKMKGNVLKDTEPKAALEAFELSKKYMYKYNFERLITDLNAMMAACYARIGQPAKARELIGDNSNTVYNTKNDQFTSYKFERLLAEIDIYKAEKNWEMALERQADYMNLQNEIHASEVSRLESGLNSLEASALSKSQERELLLQSQLLQSNKRLLNILIVVGFMFLMLLVLLFFQNSKNQKLAQKYLNISHKNELLIKEQSHRVKNNLQVISSLIGLQKNRLKNKEIQDSLGEMQGRISVMSVLQQLFYESNDSVKIKIGDYFEQILNKTEVIFNKPVERFFSVENALIDPDLAIHLGIIYNELLTNSFKYAFGFENLQPKVSVSFFIKKGELYFEYKDNGSNPNLLIFEKEFYTTSQSFGLSLIRLKSSELAGDYSFAYENGLKFKLKCIYHEAKSLNS